MNLSKRCASYFRIGPSLSYTIHLKKIPAFQPFKGDTIAPQQRRGKCQWHPHANLAVVHGMQVFQEKIWQGNMECSNTI